MHAEMWIDRLLATEEGRARLDEAVDELWPYALGVLDGELRPELRGTRRGAARSQRCRRRGRAARRPRGRARRAVGGDDLGAALGAGGRAMVTAEEVWDALAEIPDPEIPVISLVDLGVVKNVEVEDGTRAGRLHADVHGLPGARGDAARDGGEGSRSSAREPDVTRPARRLVVDRRHNSRGTREATRGRLRAAHPEAGRRKIELVQLQRGFRCPYCGSTRHEAREPLRPDAVPLDPLLRELPPAVRAVQDDLTRVPTVSVEIFYCPT